MHFVVIGWEPHLLSPFFVRTNAACVLLATTKGGQMLQE